MLHHLELVGEFENFKNETAANWSFKTEWNIFKPAWKYVWLALIEYDECYYWASKPI